jgi:hypothetical protein
MNLESVMSDVLKTIENYSNGALLKDRDRLTEPVSFLMTS